MTWRYLSLRCCAESLFRSWSGMGNLFTPAYLKRRNLAVYRFLKPSPSPWPTRLCSIRPPSLFLTDTSTFQPRRPPDSPGETFGATRFSLILSSEVCLRPHFNAQTHLQLHQMFSECFCKFSSKLNI